ncbi:MAG: hypothetical protein KC503_28815 [Myxococcales bacterium]|nr:hypothetical protein [Myxococcales bacterium]
MANDEGFHEYLELYSYFGRSDMPRLTRDQYHALDAEFVRLCALERPLSAEDIRQVAQLKTLLFRDRPRLADLRKKRPGRERGAP